MKTNLLNKINNKKAVVGIIGLGYVGLPLLLRYVEKGFEVIGFDDDIGKIKSLTLGKSYINHISESRLKKSLNKKLSIVDNFKKISEVDILILCLPSPLTKNREPDLSSIISAMHSILPYLKKGQAISLESTTYPGTTEEKLLPLITSKGFKVGTDFFLIYSPEREDPGNKNFQTHQIPKIVSGYTSNCLDIGIASYEVAIEKIVPVSSLKVAEMSKLLENIYRAVNIGMVNEMKIVADKMGINIHEVINAAATKPFGYTPYFPGPGLGGHCLPIDPFYLSWKAREFNINARFIELAGEINVYMPRWVVEKVSEALNIRKKILNGSKILILGVAYKKDIDDVRESPAIEIIKILKSKGGIVDFSDPYVKFLITEDNNNKKIDRVNISAKKLKTYDVAILVTNHTCFDYELLEQNSNLLVDTRGVYNNLSNNVIRA